MDTGEDESLPEGTPDAPRLVLRAGHVGRVTAAALSPNGCTLATGGTDHLVLLWRLPDGALLRRMPGAYCQLTSLAFLGDAGKIAGRSCSDILVWDAGTGDLLHTLSGFRGQLRGDADPNLLHVTDRESERLVDIRSGQVVRQSPISANPGDTVSAASPQHVGHVRTTRQGAETPMGLAKTVSLPRGDANDMAFSPNAEWLAVGYQPGGVRVWDVKTGELRHSFRPSPRFYGRLAVSPDGRQIATCAMVGDAQCYGALIELWDAESGQLRDSWHLEEGAPADLAFSVDGSILVVTGTARIRGTSEFRQVTYALEAASGVVRFHLESDFLGFSPDGKLMLTTEGSDGLMQIRVPETGSLIRSLEPPEYADSIFSVAFSPDSRRCCVGFQGRGVGCWDLVTGQRRWEHTAHVDFLGATAVSGDGTRFAVGGVYWPHMAVWDIEAGQEVFALAGHVRGTRVCRYHPTGNLLVSAGGDGAVRFWNADDERLRLTLDTLPEQAEAENTPWIAYTPEGYFHGSEGILQHLAWEPRPGAELLPGETHAPRFHRPDIISRVLRE